MQEGRLNRTRKTIKRNIGAGARRAMYGPADQMAYERDERMERRTMLDRIAGERKATSDAAERARKKQVARKAGERGTNAGTIGGSRPNIIRAMFGR